jgi:hypothetical protein
MRRALLIALLLSESARAASCCVGGSPKTFIHLRRLQTYELGLSTSVRDVYARYDFSGARHETDGNQTYSLTWGAGARLVDGLQAFAAFPLVHQVNKYGSLSSTRTLPGDSILGITWTAVEHLFFDDWYPTVLLTAGAKLPTGRVERVENGRRSPGTGNGLWEPFFGVALRKDFEYVTFSVTANFNRPFGLLENGITDGNRWEVIESLSIPIGRRLSLGGGAAQTWIAEKAQNGALLPNSAERSLGAFATATYFITPLVEMTGTFDFSLPMERLSYNYAAYRALTFTVKYGFY